MNKKLEEFNEKLKQSKIAVIGLGVSNIPLIEYLSDLKCNFTLFDKREYDKLDSNVIEIIKKHNPNLSLGDNYMEKLKGFDIIFRSPSCLPTNPYLVKEKNNGALITTEIEQVLRLSPATIIGITGSDGKTTTTTLTYKLLKALGYKTYVGGNIGTPLFTSIKDMTKDDMVVLELSSFQLMEMNISPNIAAITNISPNHLDIHSSYSEYIEAKKNIFKHQKENDILVLNYDDELVKTFNKEAKSKVRYFSYKHRLKDNYYLDGDYIKYNDNIILDTRKLKIRGVHNYINICTCLNIIKDYLNIDKVKSELLEFTGVEHRIEFIREINGVKWYNDSASSSPTRTIAGLNAFSEDVILIAGGYDKNIPYKPLATPILNHCSKLILFGKTKNKIYDAIMEEKKKTGNNKLQIYVMDTLDEVIEVAYKTAIKGEVVLFSPASASFDMFKNAYQRGDIFKEKVNKL